MTLAEELAYKHGLHGGMIGEDFPDKDAVAAINEALERAAQECHADLPLQTPRYDYQAQKTRRECAARIRALKSEAQP